MKPLSIPTVLTGRSFVTPYFRTLHLMLEEFIKHKPEILTVIENIETRKKEIPKISKMCAAHAFNIHPLSLKKGQERRRAGSESIRIELELLARKTKTLEELKVKLTHVWNAVNPAEVKLRHIRTVLV